MRMTRWTLVLVLALAAAGCGGPGVEPSSQAASAANATAPGADGGIEGTWQLESGRVGGRDLPVLELHPITLSFAGTSVNGVAGCNEYGGRIQLSGGVPSIAELGQTDMRCEDPGLGPDDIMEAETAFLQALMAAAEVSRDGAALVLRGPDMEMRFTELPPPPTADVVGTVWVLETLFVGDVASEPEGDPATLELRADGSFVGSTGCRSFSGRWMERANQIIAPEMGMDQVHCAAALAAQDSHVVSVVGDGFVPTVEGDLLTLTDPGGVGLVYRAPDGG